MERRSRALGPVCIVTPSQQWAYAAIWPCPDSSGDPLAVSLDATVEHGRIGVAVATEDLAQFISQEVECPAAAGRSIIEITVPAPIVNMKLVLRNTAAGGIASRVVIHEITTSGPHGKEVWIDVGAHLGEKTFASAEQNPALRVYAFEPNLRVASQLMGRLRNYIVLPIAIAEHDGSAPFYRNRFAAASSLLSLSPSGLARWAGGEVLEVEDVMQVPTLRLDTFLNGAGIEKVAYLKIDAQGADLAVVRSAGERLRDIERMALEVQTAALPLYEGAASKEEVLAYLSAAGFVLTSCEKQTDGQEENLVFERA
jgi:FkbM family methyltransferase